MDPRHERPLGLRRTLETKDWPCVAVGVEMGVNFCVVHNLLSPGGLYMGGGCVPANCFRVIHATRLVITFPWYRPCVMAAFLICVSALLFALPVLSDRLLNLRSDRPCRGCSQCLRNEMIAVAVP